FAGLVSAPGSEARQGAGQERVPVRVGYPPWLYRPDEEASRKPAGPVLPPVPGRLLRPANPWIRAPAAPSRSGKPGKMGRLAGARSGKGHNLDGVRGLAKPARVGSPCQGKAVGMVHGRSQKAGA